jgi:hypothetical protein
MKPSRSLIPVTLALGVLVVSGPAFADPCRDAAVAFLADNPATAAIYFDAADTPPTPIGKSILAFAPSAAVAEAVRLEGFEKGQIALVDETHGTCPGLAAFQLTAVGTSAQPAPKIANDDPEKARKARHQTTKMELEATSLDDLAEDWLRDARVVAPGAAQGASDVAAEALQILGQIVVDRASNQGYRLLKKKITTALSCEKIEDAKVKLPETCKVLEALRLQDLATAPEALVEALATDLATEVLDRAAASDPFSKAVVAFSPIILKRLLRGGVEGVGVTDVELLLGEVVRIAADEVNATDPWKKAVIGGVLALGACVAAEPQNVSGCGLQRWVDEVAKKLHISDQEQRALAREIAADLHAALTMQAAPGAPPPSRERFVRVVDVLLRAACAWTATTGEEWRCPDVNEIKGLTTARDRTALFNHVVQAIIKRDRAPLVVAAVRTVELRVVGDAEDVVADRKTYSKAVTLLGGVIQYAATYTKDADADGAHEARTKILESLTTSMTDRSGRQGDAIFSVGGSLRGLGGGRFSTAKKGETAIAGPVSLPLGFALDVTASEHPVGFHGELGLVDLGQYVTLDTESDVSKPDPRAAFAPSVTVALGIGVEFPFFVGAAAGWTPFVRATEAAPDDDMLGSLYVGGVAGFYVPFVDLN